MIDVVDVEVNVIEELDDGLLIVEAGIGATGGGDIVKCVTSENRLRLAAITFMGIAIPNYLKRAAEDDEEKVVAEAKKRGMEVF